MLVSFGVVLNALSGPPIRATVFRTDPVLRALGVPDEEPAGELAALTAVPSLSASPRFVLPLVREDGKRDPGGAAAADRRPGTRAAPRFWHCRLLPPRYRHSRTAPTVAALAAPEPDIRRERAAPDCRSSRTPRRRP